MVIKLVGNSKNFFRSRCLIGRRGWGLIGCSNDEVRIHNRNRNRNASVRDADEKCGALRRNRNAVQYIEEVVKSVQFSPSESIKECLEMYVFPRISGPKRKAYSLAYMVKGLLLTCTGCRRCDNRDDFQNKMFKLVNELLERRPYGDRNVRPTQHYLDASITANSPQKAFSTGAWSRHGRMERISRVVEVLLFILKGNVPRKPGKCKTTKRRNHTPTMQRRRIQGENDKTHSM
ncbi:DNA-directed RNA polymerase D subunit 2b, partial [Mucuna pruriens]